MGEEDLTVRYSTLVPFIEAQQTDHASSYHSFEIVSVNYILEGKGSMSQNCQTPSL